MTAGEMTGEAFLPGFTKEIKEYTRAVKVRPVVSTIPFICYVFETENPYKGSGYEIKSFLRYMGFIGVGFFFFVSGFSIMTKYIVYKELQKNRLVIMILYIFAPLYKRIENEKPLLSLIFLSLAWAAFTVIVSCFTDYKEILFHITFFLINACSTTQKSCDFNVYQHF